jgi:hypothetical protein
MRFSKTRQQIEQAAFCASYDANGVQEDDAHFRGAGGKRRDESQRGGCGESNPEQAKPPGETACSTFRIGYLRALWDYSFAAYPP